MALNYEKLQKKQEQGDSFWTSYADLATVQSVLFLLLYSAATLRTTSISLSQKMVTLEKQQEIEALEQQIKAYEVLKEDYLTKGASAQEKEMYEKVLTQMQLLEEKARREKEDQLAKATANAEKEKGLNQYQSIIKNIINANVLAQSKLKKRDDIIAKKTKSISELKKNIREREQLIDANNREISQINKKLHKSIEEVKYAYRSKANSKRKAEQEIARLKADSVRQIHTLQSKNREASQQLDEAKNMIVAKTQLLKQKENEVSKLAEEKSKILGDLERKEHTYQRSMADLEATHRAVLARERKVFEDGLKKEKLTSAAQLERERQYRTKVEQEKAAFNSKMGELTSQLRDTQKAIHESETRYKDSINKLATAKGGLERQLAAIQQRDAEKRKVADEIRKNFARAGINADINMRTGEVTIHFGEEYFDYGSAELKNGMMTVLRKAIPIYAKSLLSDSKIAQKVNSVEIIGFASPTYRGKYVNPKDLGPEARHAVNYNMDLSYQRAKSIFEYVFDTKQMRYSHQKDLLSLTKVSGLSYLRSQSAGDSTLSDAEYCEKYDCAKSQKVLIKFNFDENLGDGP